MEDFDYNNALSNHKKQFKEQLRLINKKKVNFELPIVVVYETSASDLKRGVTIMKVIEHKF